MHKMSLVLLLAELWLVHVTYRRLPWEKCEVEAKSLPWELWPQLRQSSPLWAIARHEQQGGKRRNEDWEKGNTMSDISQEYFSLSITFSTLKCFCVRREIILFSTASPTQKWHWGTQSVTLWQTPLGHICAPRCAFCPKICYKATSSLHTIQPPELLMLLAL